jgi:leader peptidase (prepilin peptidase) / N-methyltransferase
LIEAALRASGGIVIGVAVGSFITNWALRYARGEQGLTGRSHCESCQVSLSFAQSAPLVAYAALGGRCRHCRANIDPVHPAGELAGGLVGLFSIQAATPAEIFLRAGLGFLLLALAVIDLKTFRLPDALSAGVALACAGLAVLRGELLAGAIASAITTALLMAVRYAKRADGQRGIGLGDIKLAAGLALWLGAMTSWMVVAAAGLALIFVGRQLRHGCKLPYGPWLAAAALLVGSFRELSGWTGLNF